MTDSSEHAERDRTAAEQEYRNREAQIIMFFRKEGVFLPGEWDEDLVRTIQAHLGIMPITVETIRMVYQPAIYFLENLDQDLNS